VFSGVLSKVAAYAFLRIVTPLLPDASAHFQTLMLLIGLASVLYGSAMAFTTTDTRLILGYSSIAQLGFITMGIFSLTSQGAQGAILQSFNHGLVVAPAFFLVGAAAARSSGSEDLRDMGGIAFRAPVLTAMFLIVAMANLAIPGSSNFVGEFLILLGVFNAKLVIAIIAFTGVALASVYTLRLFIRAMHNRPGKDVESRELSLSDSLCSSRSSSRSSHWRSTRSCRSTRARPPSRHRSPGHAPSPHRTTTLATRSTFTITKTP